LVIATTAPATAPRTVVAAEPSVDGFGAAVFAVDRDAAARAALFLLAAFVLATVRFRVPPDCVALPDFFAGARFAATRLPRRRGVDALLVFFPTDRFLPDVRLATPASCVPDSTRRDQNERRLTPLNRS
jgi:hypothetical protein